MNDAMKGRRGAEQSPLGRLTDIDALRGIAVLMVLLAHTPGVLIRPVPDWLAPMSNMFAVGVEVFFAVSGFVIGRALLGEMERASRAGSWWKATKEFWIRRAWRLLPAAYLWLLIPCLLSLVFNKYGNFGPPKATAFAALAAVVDLENIELAYRFVHKLLLIPINHYWSLSLEEQFYFVIPVLLILPKRALWTILFVMPIVSCVATGPYAGLLKIEEISYGFLLASAMHGGLLPQPRWDRALGCKTALVVGAFSLLAAVAALSMVPPGFTGWSLAFFAARLSIALCCTALVLIAAMDVGGIVGRGLIYKAMLFVGGRSYSIYLVHPCSFLLAQEIVSRIGEPDPLGGYALPITICAGWVLTAAFAEPTYRFVEQRFRLPRVQSHEIEIIPGYASGKPSDAAPMTAPRSHLQPLGARQRG